MGGLGTWWRLSVSIVLNTSTKFHASLAIQLLQNVLWPFGAREKHKQPETFHGARVVESGSFPFPWYTQLPLTLALSPRIYREIK